jgi:FPC/CPF motif-containing protein YcgG
MAGMITLPQFRESPETTKVQVSFCVAVEVLFWVCASRGKARHAKKTLVKMARSTVRNGMHPI